MLAGQQEIVADRPLVAQLDAAAAGFVELIHQSSGVRRRKLHRRQRADVVMADGVGETQGPLVVAADHQPAHAGLFPEVSQTALKRRPGGTVAGVEAVEHLARRVHESEIVKPPRELLAE